MKKALVLVLLLFIAGCSKKPEVTTLKSGVKFADDTVGTGAQANLGDLVSVRLTGWVIKDSSDLFGNWVNDTSKMMNIFASTKMRPDPLKILLNGQSFIKGSDEGIVGMKVGGTRTIILPASKPNPHPEADMMPPHPALKLQIKLISTKPGVVAKPYQVDSTKFKTTKDGLKYEIVQEGSGPVAQDSNLVTINYTGYFLNGDKFDSSVEKDQPFTFQMGRPKALLPGLEEGIRFLNKGAKARFIIPPALAFKDMMVGRIQPNTTVVFDVEVLDIR